MQPEEIGGLILQLLHEGARANNVDLDHYKVKTFHVYSFKVDKLVPKDKAKVSFHIQVEAAALRGDRPPPIRCESEFVWENERWCLQGFKLFYANLGNEFSLPP